MKLTSKIAFVLLCISLCGTGAIMVSKAPEKRKPQKTKAMPVKNHEIVRRIWIVAAVCDRR
ncbi:MAG: hypothetical protein ACREIW_02335 [Chthoniobacterales bacterium]